MHEGAHGIIEAVEPKLDELMDRDYSRIVFEESIATLVGLSYAEKFLADEAARYKAFMSGYKTDDVHEEAFRLVLEDRGRVEAMVDLVKQLHVLKKSQAKQHKNTKII